MTKRIFSARGFIDRIGKPLKPPNQSRERQHQRQQNHIKAQYAMQVIVQSPPTRIPLDAKFFPLRLPKNDARNKYRRKNQRRVCHGGFPDDGRQPQIEMPFENEAEKIRVHVLHLQHFSRVRIYISNVIIAFLGVQENHLRRVRRIAIENRAYLFVRSRLFARRFYLRRRKKRRRLFLDKAIRLQRILYFMLEAIAATRDGDNPKQETGTEY